MNGKIFKFKFRCNKFNTKYRIVDNKFTITLLKMVLEIMIEHILKIQLLWVKRIFLNQ